jgi:hypothetical protein
MSKQFNESNDKFDTFTKMYRKVLASNDLSFLQKFILSDVISFQLDNKPYMRTSKSLAKMLGDYGKGTISKGFQELAKKGIIITRPDSYGDKTDSQYDLRSVEVVNINQWVRSDEYLESNGFVPVEITPQSNWMQSKTNTKEAKAKRLAESINIDLTLSEAYALESIPLMELEAYDVEEITQSNENVTYNQTTIFDGINLKEWEPLISDSTLPKETQIIDDSSIYSNKCITLQNGLSVRILEQGVYFFNETAKRSDGFVREGKSKSNQIEFDEYLLNCMNIKF